MWGRHVHERALSTVILSVDLEEVSSAAERASVSTQAFLGALRSVGVTAVGVHEYTLQHAVEDGRAFLLTHGGLEAFAKPGSPGRATDRDEALEWPPQDQVEASPYLFGVLKATDDAWFWDALGRNLPEQFQLVISDERVALWQFPRTQSLANVSLGFNPRDLEAAREAGLDIIPRLRPTDGRSLEQVKDAIDQVDGAAAIVFWGAAATGYPDALGEVAGYLALLDAPVGLIEFAVQRGVSEVAKSLDYRAVRVHSITEGEMQARIGQDVAVRRWERAVRERGVRLLYVRLYPGASLDETIAYLGAIADRLRGAGYELGRIEAVGGPPGRSPLWILIFSAAMTGAAGAWLVGQVFRLRLDARRVAAGAVAVSIVFLLLWLKGHTVLARQMLAGLAAVIYPPLAALVGLACARAGVRNVTATKGPAIAAGLRPGWIGFAVSVALALCGAMAVIVALDDVRFLLKIEEFRGVKAAYVAPLAVVAAAFLLEWARPSTDLNRQRVSQTKKLLAAFSMPIKLWHVAVAAGALGVFAVYLLRSGNQGLPTFGFEVAVRTFLEETFAARPRTKEFLIGHPAMIAAYALVGASGYRRWRAPLLFLLVLLGTVGPVSVINTFAHAHSPLDLSLMRTGYGLLLGSLFGTGFAALLLRIAAASTTSEDALHQSQDRLRHVGPGSNV